MFRKDLGICGLASFVRFFAPSTETPLTSVPSTASSCILANPASGGLSHRRESEKTVKALIMRWRVGDVLDLWNVVLDSEDYLNLRRRPKKPSPESLREANAKRDHRAVADGQYTKAFQALSSDGFAPVSDDVLAVHDVVEASPGWPPTNPLGSCSN